MRVASGLSPKQNHQLTFDSLEEAVIYFSDLNLFLLHTPIEVIKDNTLLPRLSDSLCLKAECTFGDRGNTESKSCSDCLLDQERLLISLQSIRRLTFTQFSKL